MTENARRRRKKGKQGYQHKSNALNMTVYDARGEPLPEDLVNEFLEQVNGMALDRGLWFMYTTT